MLPCFIFGQAKKHMATTTSDTKEAAKPYEWQSCARCKQPTSEPNSFALQNGICFHVACFSCKDCNEKLILPDFFIKEEEYYCAYHAVLRTKPNIQAAKKQQLFVKILEVKNLPTMPHRVYVSLTLGTQKHATQAVTRKDKQNVYKIRKHSRFNVTDDVQQQQLILKVYDQAVLQRTILGILSVPLDDLVDGLPVRRDVLLDNTGAKLCFMLTATGFGKPMVPSLLTNMITETQDKQGNYSVSFSNDPKSPIPIQQSYFFKQGDIILFKTPDLLGKSTRMLTKSEWDHIGLVVYHSDSDYNNSLQRIPCLLEAVETGVKVYPNIMARLDKYGASMICVRKLNREMTKEEHGRLHAVINQLVGRQYKFDILQMLRAVRHGKGIIFDNREDLSKIFCSELIASCLQHVDILSSELSSNSFTPRDFGEGKSLPLLNAAYSHEIYIVNSFK